ncbi:DUF5677 domain-containing protein [Larkinella insperata]|uniref:DUF5677 domain-containing protein n=1 Tax=Larkinella insperata TaxID=332158 RepID=A0ABW3QMI6_9BACT|nr:DUF5677 domain-containing protein [Larkinella insperata]
MNAIQKIFDSIIEETITLEKLSEIFVREKLKKLNITLSDEKINELLNTIKNGEDKELFINHTINGIEQRINLLDNEDDTDEIVMPIVENAILRTSESLKRKYVKILLNRFDKEASYKLKNYLNSNIEFETYLKSIWGEAIDLLELFINVIVETGAAFTEEYEKNTDIEQDFVYEAAARLHARSCQIAYEILTLIKAGYANGAHARWRSLHEFSVILFFIKEKGQDVAERFLKHVHIENYKAAEEHQKNYIKLNKLPISEIDMNKLKIDYESCIQKYGQSFSGDYGWAVSALNAKRLTFKDIESHVSLSHLRPNYKKASSNVHVSSKGLLSKLNLEPVRNNLLSVGPSIFGLVEPSHSLAVSLSQVTTAYLLLKPNIDHLAICEFISKIEKDIRKKLIAAEWKLVEFNKT